jgi:hypothetical protein
LGIEKQGVQASDQVIYRRSNIFSSVPSCQQVAMQMARQSSKQYQVLQGNSTNYSTVFGLPLKHKFKSAMKAFDLL